MPDKLKPSRTPAQRQASRRNGARSRGPVTTAGKARSARNSLKHGLLAKKLAPADDVRGERQLFEDTLADLADEYPPKSVVQRLRLVQLAHDIVHAVRAGRILEVAQAPLFQPDMEDKLPGIRTRRKLRQDAALAAEALAEGQDLRLTGPRAAELADQFAAMIESVLDNQLTYREQDETADDQPSAEACDDVEEQWPPTAAQEADRLCEEEDREERARHDRLHRWVYPLRGRLKDRGHLTALFSGNAVPNEREQRAVPELLRVLVEDLEIACYGDQKVEQRLQSQADRSVSRLSQDPQPLMLLRRYQRELDADIDRKVAQLEG